MSTASVVEFGQIQLYVHHDGYPEHMIPLLREFLKWNHSRLDDAGYTAANFIYWYKKRALKKARAMTREYPAKPRQHKGFLLQIEQTGVGLFEYSTRREMHDNCISYYYKVHLPTLDWKVNTDRLLIDVYDLVKWPETKPDEKVEVTI